MKKGRRVLARAETPTLNTRRPFRARRTEPTRPKALPIRPFKFPDNGAAGWVAKNYPADQRERKSFLVLFVLAGCIDAGHADISIRELSHHTTLDPKRVLQHLVKLEREGWITAQWAQGRFAPNVYRINYERTPVLHHDPYRSTYQPKRKPKGGPDARQQRV